uniref:Uncharacterized protein n=2 Tax=Globisporangium ultimum (strain ATCC 200006 / CBS 805.95 / DAOM BR144) TaxID=431595 RepID=K3WCQ3_GLOUD
MAVKVVAGGPGNDSNSPPADPNTQEAEDQGSPRFTFLKPKQTAFTAMNLTTKNGANSNDKVLQLVNAIQKRKRQMRAKIYDEQLPFSWARLFSGIFSLILVCSDVSRSGLGIKRFPSEFLHLEPDVFEEFGPWHYPVANLFEVNATNVTARVWSYKFDSTSNAHRAFGEFYELSSFPDCIIYRAACPETTFNGKVAFDMLDSIVDVAARKNAPNAVDSQETLRRKSTEPQRIALRTANHYLDRLHHHLLPELFVNNIYRTNQLFYYPPEILSKPNGALRSTCFDYRIRPHFCQELWSNFRRSCPQHDTNCKAAGVLWVNTLQRLRVIQQTYPTMQVDLAFLESQEDRQVFKGGLSPSGLQRGDVTAIIRVRDCDSNMICTTKYIDEYRYEVGFLISQAVQWYRGVAILRGTGQVYYYIRITMLLVFCYKVTPATHPQRSSKHVHVIATRCYKACVLFLKAPVQSVIFGSPFPIFCYACAHVIDASTSYEILGNIFNSAGGVFQLKFRDLLTVGFNQMRSVWLLAFLLHTFILLETSRRGLNWAPVSGIRGVPEFMLSGLSSVTIMAQFRSTKFRNAKIYSIFEIT